MNRKKIALLLGIAFIVITIPTVLFLISQRQDPRQRASDGDQVCPAPEATLSVLVDFPACSDDGINCDLSQASCEWDAVSGASSYLVTINQVEDGTFVKNNESVPTTTLKLTFPITQNKTYKCSVIVVSACASQSIAVTDELLCEADAILDPTATPAPTTSAPTSAPIPTATLIPPTPTLQITNTPTPQPIFLPTATYTPTPTIVQPGGIMQTIGIVGGIMIVVVGGILLLAL